MQLKNIPVGNYSKISAVYISLIDGTGCICDNCGRLIANIVTVKNEDNNKQYTIGQDCAKTLFSDKENKEIDREIKDGIRLEKYEKEVAKRAVWNESYNEVKALYYARGGNDKMINEQPDRAIYNTCLAEVEQKRSMYISYKR